MAELPGSLHAHGPGRDPSTLSAAALKSEAVRQLMPHAS